MTREIFFPALKAPSKTCFSSGLSGRPKRDFRALKRSPATSQENHPINNKEARYFALMFSPM